MDKFKRAVTIGYLEKGYRPSHIAKDLEVQPQQGGHCQQWGGEGRQTLEHFASARQGGRGQEQEGGTGEEGGQEGVQPRGVYWTCP